MGCDIHIVLERKLPGDEWIGVWSSDLLPVGKPMIAQRDYGFFAEVAAVRGHSDTSKWPRNLPRDISRLAWVEYMRCPTDYHSASHMTVGEFLDAYKRANPTEKKGYRPDFAAYDLLNIEADWPEGADYRVVFWFDN